MEKVTSARNPQFDLRKTPYDFFKRGVDIFISLIALLFAGPFMLYIARLVRKDSPGPALYRSPRVGKDGRVFQMLKFRTMYETPESYNGPKVTAHDDPRITRLGKWLRDTKLNELPQLWNVLKGEMSLVGPRPEDPEIAAGWPEEVRDELLSVRPGVTSPASVVYRNEESLMINGQALATYLEEILPSKHRLDQLYVRNRSFWSDMDVIFWTALSVIPSSKVTTPPEELLYAGPIWQLMRRYFSWFVIDMLVTFVAFGLTGLILRSFGPLDIGLLRAVGLAFGFALLYSLVGALFGVQKVFWSKAPAEDAFVLLPPVGAATAIALVVNHLVHRALPDQPQTFYWSSEPLLPWAAILITSAIALSGFVIVRFRDRLATGLATRWVAMRGSPITSEKVLLVGGGETGQFAAWMLQNGKYASSLHVVGMVDDDLFKQGVRIQGVGVLGQIKDIPELVAKHQVGIIVFAIHNIHARERREILNSCASTPAKVVIFPDIHAALRHVQGSEYQPWKSGESPRPREKALDLLPCEICLTRTSPMRVDDWLAHLESFIDKGDLPRLKEEITALRQNLRLDVQVQIQANIGTEPVDQRETKKGRQGNEALTTS